MELSTDHIATQKTTSQGNTTRSQQKTVPEGHSRRLLKKTVTEDHTPISLLPHPSVHIPSTQVYTGIHPLWTENMSKNITFAS